MSLFEWLSQLIKSGKKNMETVEISNTASRFLMKNLARRQEEGFEYQMNKVMEGAKQFFKTIANEPTELVEAEMKGFLKSKKIASFQTLRFYSVKV